MSSTSLQKPSRWRWMVLSLVTVGALVVPTGIIYLQHRLEAQPNDTARPWDDPVVAKKLSNARLDKAKAIRAEWLTWAKSHQVELKAMLDSQGKNLSAAQAVYKVSPPLRLNDWRPETKGGPAKFAWISDLYKMEANGSSLRWGDAQSKALFEKQRGSGQQKLKTEYGEMSDFVVGVSENPGPTVTQLWASGRITERTLVANPNRRSGQLAFVQEPYKELVPPFDFLTADPSN